MTGVGRSFEDREIGSDLDPGNSTAFGVINYSEPYKYSILFLGFSFLISLNVVRKCLYNNVISVKMIYNAFFMTMSQ